MSRINILLANASGRFTKESEQKIYSSIKVAENYTFPKLKINWDIDIVVADCGPVSAIPEDRVGGHTYASDFIILRVGNDSIGPFISEIVCHELCHSARWGKNDEWMNTLFDAVIFEGLATYFEYEFTKTSKEKQFFIKTILNRSDEENKKILSVLKPELDNNQYDYDTIFFKGNDILPRWSGYSLGFYLVKKYLEQNNTRIENIFANKYDEFRSLI